MGAGQSSSLSRVGRGTELRPHDHSLRPGSATYHFGVLELGHPAQLSGAPFTLKGTPRAQRKKVRTHVSPTTS